jgi:hypothetical protein
VRTDRRLRGGWGRPVLKAICDHSPYRTRLFEADSTEIPVTYYTCRRCGIPLFLGVDDRPVEVFKAEDCGCVWPSHLCSYHAHPVNGGGAT